MSSQERMAGQNPGSEKPWEVSLRKEW